MGAGADKAMSIWDQEIDLILRGDLKAAAESYIQKRTDITFGQAMQIVGEVAKRMNVTIKHFVQKIKVKT